MCLVAAWLGVLAGVFIMALVGLDEDLDGPCWDPDCDCTNEGDPA